MTYAPFERGPFPVGVQTDTWTDVHRDRALPVEIWYPADARHAGQDLDPSTWDTFTPGWFAEGTGDPDLDTHQTAVRDATWSEDGTEELPLVLLVHGWAGYRREATFLGTHLASHGYVVVSPDVLGSTYADVDAFLSAEGSGAAEALGEHVRGIAEARRGDIPFLISTATAKLPVRPTGVGVVGASFGGWSSLIAPAVDERVGAVIPMCPANGDAPLFDPGTTGTITDDLELSWLTDAPVLMLVGDRDSLLPLYGQLTVLRALPASTKQMVVLARADHNHFVDDIDVGQAWLKEYAERLAALYPDGPGDWTRIARSIEPIEHLVPGEKAKVAWQGLTVAHFDAYLRRLGRAHDLLRNPDAALAALDIEVNTVRVDA